MDENLVNKNESATSSLMELLKKYTTRVDERETLVKESPTSQQSRKLNIQFILSILFLSSN
jgi:hypothetical protein